jgi:MtN3 and saliva related transmembrane protein
MYMGIVEAGVNIFFGLGLFINAVFFVPQAWKIFRQKSSQGLSLVTYGGFNVIQLLMALHGYFHQDFGLMIGMSLSFITCGAVTIGIFHFGYKKAKG